MLYLWDCWISARHKYLFTRAQFSLIPLGNTEHLFHSGSKMTLIGWRKPFWFPVIWDFLPPWCFVWHQSLFSCNSE